MYSNKSNMTNTYNTIQKRILSNNRVQKHKHKLQHNSINNLNRNTNNNRRNKCKSIDR